MKTGRCDDPCCQGGAAGLAKCFVDKVWNHPPYFGRFFRRRVGAPPEEFRQTHRLQSR